MSNECIPHFGRKTMDVQKASMEYKEIDESNSNKQKR